MAHFVLIYDRVAGALLRQQQYANSADALVARFAAEDEFRARSEVEIVDLSAGSEEELRRTHARYFLSLDQLAARIG